MKIILITLLFSLSLFGAKLDNFASGVKYFRDYDSAFLKAKKEKKLLMLVIVKDDCAWCKKLERSTLANEKVRQKVLDNVPVIIDQKHEKGKIPKKYLAELFPTVIFIDPKNNKEFYKFIGYVKKNDFLLILKDVKSKYVYK